MTGHESQQHSLTHVVWDRGKVTLRDSFSGQKTRKTGMGHAESRLPNKFCFLTTFAVLDLQVNWIISLCRYSRGNSQGLAAYYAGQYSDGLHRFFVFLALLQHHLLRFRGQNIGIHIT